MRGRWRRCRVLLCASEDDYYISLSLITFCVFFLVDTERGLLHLGRLVLPGHVGAEVADADEVLARRSGSVQLQREDLVGVPGSGGGQVVELRGVVKVPRGVLEGVVKRAGLVVPRGRPRGRRLASRTGPSPVSAGWGVG